MAYDFKVAGTTIDYVPKWEQQRANFKLGIDSEPVTFTLKCVTMKDSEEWSKRAFQLSTPSGVSEEGPSEDETNLELSKQQIISGIEEIKNLKYDGVEIVSGAELWGTPFKDLILEVGRAITQWSILTAGDIRNLRPESAGSSEETSTSAQTA